MKKNFLEVPFNNLTIQHSNLKSKINLAIQSVIQSSAFIRGKYVKLFEEKFSKMYDNFNCISCANGTDAIYLALKSLNIKKGDEVLVPSISWIASSETVSQCGARVNFVDVDEDCLIDINKFESQITKKTKAVIIVHLYGKPCNMTKIMKIAKKHKLFVIEDCAQAHFAEWKNKKVGTFGDFGTFSFYPGKNIGALGDAGCLITRNEKLASISRALANHGSSSKNKHDHIYEGINSRMDGIQAAILNIKLNYITKWNLKRKNIALKYFKYLSDNKNIILPS
jgi:dTDP-4-amino-4,6-dideoxygalactose transaminase